MDRVKVLFKITTLLAGWLAPAMGKGNIGAVGRQIGSPTAQVQGYRALAVEDQIVLAERGQRGTFGALSQSAGGPQHFRTDRDEAVATQRPLCPSREKGCFPTFAALASAWRCVVPLVNKGK